MWITSANTLFYNGLEISPSVEKMLIDVDKFLRIVGFSISTHFFPTFSTAFYIVINTFFTLFHRFNHAKN